MPIARVVPTSAALYAVCLGEGSSSRACSWRSKKGKRKAQIMPKTQTRWSRPERKNLVGVGVGARARVGFKARVKARVEVKARLRVRVRARARARARARVEAGRTHREGPIVTGDVAGTRPRQLVVDW